jgi:hypothetical protein
MARKIGIWALVLGLVFVVAVGCASSRIRKVVPAYDAKVKKLQEVCGTKAPYETTLASAYMPFFEHEVGEGDEAGAALFEQGIDQAIQQGTAKCQ